MYIDIDLTEVNGGIEASRLVLVGYETRVLVALAGGARPRWPDDETEIPYLAACSSSKKKPMEGKMVVEHG